jgi:hypothetical protein
MLILFPSSILIINQPMASERLEFEQHEAQIAIPAECKVLAYLFDT